MNPIGLTRPRTWLRFWIATLVACAVFAAPAGAATSSTTTTTTTTAASTTTAAASTPPPTSTSQFEISGGGFGHGIGMSQYGAAGLALHGWTYKQILSHYYSQTTLGHVNPNKTVTVLLHEGAATFSGVTRIKGYAQVLSAKTNYGVLVVGKSLRLISGGRIIGTYRSPLTVSGPGTVKLVGQGTYHGSFVFRPAPGGGVMTVNSVGLDNYVRGVVGAEMPATWPQQALEAQAIAARTYAITAGAVAADFEVYDDTRSQMYEGITAQTPATQLAVKATSGEVVEYDDAPAVTYFFASSGGYTESIQNVWSGVTPEAWLVGVPDPYDDSYNNPYYRWSDGLAVSTAAAKLKAYYKGTFEGVQVTQTGVSPRVVQAQVVGSAGATTITGAQLQTSLNTLSTYMQFATLTENGEQTATPVGPSTGTSAAGGTTTTGTTTTGSVTTTPTTTSTTPTTTTTTPPTGGSGLAASAPLNAPLLSTNASTASVSSSDYSVQGAVYPVSSGAIVYAQEDEAGVWTTVSQAQVTSAGSYVIPVPAAGVYRTLYNGADGPSVTVP